MSQDLFCEAVHRGRRLRHLIVKHHLVCRLSALGCHTLLRLVELARGPLKSLVLDLVLQQSAVVHADFACALQLRLFESIDLQDADRCEA